MHAVHATRARNGRPGGLAVELDASASTLRQAAAFAARELAVDLDDECRAAIRNLFAAGATAWIGVDASGSAVALPEPPADALEVPGGGLFATAPEVRRHQLFEADGGLAPPAFESPTDWDYWLDEASRRAGGVSKLAAELAADADLAQTLHASLGGLDDERTLEQGQKLLREGAARPSAAPDRAGRDGPQAEGPAVRDGGPGGRDAGVAGTGDRDRPGAGDRLEPDARGGGEPVAAGTGADVRRDGSPAAGAGGGSRNHRIDADALGTAHGDKTRARLNIRALETLYSLGPEGPNADEQETLAEYIGWGGIPQIFDESRDDWKADRDRLKELTTDDEYAAMRASSLNAHFTSIPVVRAIYDALEAAGYDGAGDVLEPACGTGHFIGAGPEGQRVTAVEMDAATARIAAALYPDSDVRHLPFQEFPAGTGNGEYDLVVGNPPYGVERIHDASHRDLRSLSIHNYFLAKSLRALKPGGLGGFVVSRFFLDSGNDKARELIHRSCDLLGAVRLPETAFRQNANTGVVPDVLVFRKRRADEPVPETVPDWVRSERRTDEASGETHWLNSRIAADPDAVIGEAAFDGAQFRGSCYTVRSEIPAEDQGALGAELSRRLVYQTTGRHYAPETVRAQPAGDGLPSLDDMRPSDVQWRLGGLVVHDDEIYVLKPDPRTLALTVERWEGRASEARRLVGLLGIRDATRDLLRLEWAQDADQVAMAAARERLNELVDRFRETFQGDFASQTNNRLLAPEPDRHLVLSLYDDDSGERAAILDRRVHFPDRTPAKPETVEDAAAVSFAETGRLDVEFCAGLLDKTDDEIADGLLRRGLAHRNPETGEIEWHEDYLSGNVRAKLSVARTLAEGDPAYAPNVAALEEALPADIPPEDIFVQLSSPWLPLDDALAFFRDLTGGLHVQGSRRALSGDVHIKAESYRSNINHWEQTTLLTATHGTTRADAVDLLERLIDGRPIEVRDRIRLPDGGTTTRINVEETEKARDKAREMEDAFADWVWRDPDRAERLARIYNDIANSHVVRSYDGSALRFPGLAKKDVTLRKNQRDAAYRMVCSRRALVDHAVGAGKTYTAIAGEMEKKRMGLVNKPMFVVPNHLVGQWAREFQRLYPGAAVLTMDQGQFAKAHRRDFLAKIATGDWDAIICPHSSFTLLEISPADAAAAVKHELEKLDAMLADGDGMDVEVRSTADMDPDSWAVRRERDLSVKEIEREKKMYERQLLELLDKPHSEAQLTWEQLGVDSLVVDEAQEFKNLHYKSKLRGVAGLGPPQGSKRAYDLLMKIRSMDRTHPHNTVTFLTGTPIANSVVECYHVLRYLNAGGLAERGLDDVDDWLHMFGRVSGEFEINVTGTSFKNKTRLRGFSNIPELQTLYREVADTVTNADLDRDHRTEHGTPWPVPKLRDGRAAQHILARSERLGEIIAGIVDRMEDIENRRVSADVDNVLKCLHDARTNSLDTRIQGDPLDEIDPHCKVEAAAREIMRIHAETAADRGAQLVFCDLSTPKQFYRQEVEEREDLAKRAAAGDTKAIAAIEAAPPLGERGEFDVYNELKRRLVELSGGRISASEIAFIHEAGNSTVKREKLFERVNSGDVRILMGSTAKMGTGMNVQQRLVAVHHLDVPWRPDQLEQREGRLIRQGNLLYQRDPGNFRVEVHRYATEATSDPKFWQTLETKADFIERFRSGEGTSREVDDMGEVTLSYAEMKALSSGDKRILRELELGAEVRELERRSRSHAAECRQHAWNARDLDGHENRSRSWIASVERAIAAADKHPAKRFAAAGQTVEVPVAPDGARPDPAHAKRAEAARHELGRRIGAAFKAVRDAPGYSGARVEAEYRGLPVAFESKGYGQDVRRVHVTLDTPDGVPVGKIEYPPRETFSPMGLTTRWDNQIAQLVRLRDQRAARIETDERARRNAVAGRDEPFEGAERLRKARAELTALRREMGVARDDRGVKIDTMAAGG